VLTPTTPRFKKVRAIKYINSKKVKLGSIRVLLKKNIKNAHYDEIYECVGASDGKSFVRAGKDRIIKIWSISGEVLCAFKGHVD